ncbi:MAG: helix-turn-helix transcriptional regulator [Desulfobacterales bacterium]|nr:helix-turn-helix transcriptional regulator [Desulfobacterales bacterium]MCP4159234.1 helix-turn-helix transcriptional regulator [Deltaproteobacteria bacterium]
MESTEFTQFRKFLGKTQKEMAQLVGISLKAIHSYEQGWRTIPPHIERQLFFLASKKTGLKIKKCWIVNKCPKTRKVKCPAFEFDAGELCWFINGTICGGELQKNWQEKMVKCRKCEVLTPIFEEVINFSY